MQSNRTDAFPEHKQVALLPNANHVVLLAKPHHVFIVSKLNQTVGYEPQSSGGSPEHDPINQQTPC